jgi:phenylacetate-coenzyme A ligase PaaK-like adenylate-forming protein
MDNTMNAVDQLFSLEPYSLSNSEKSAILFSEIKSLTRYHLDNNASYRNILESINYNEQKTRTLADFPFIPVRIFKEIELITNPGNLAIRSLNSSGTTGQLTSKVYIDTETSNLQTKALVKIISHYIGKHRIPMLIIDNPSTIRNRIAFSARAAGILGFSKFASKVTYALNEDMSPDWEAIGEFVRNHKESPVLIFGFTAIVWQHLIKAMETENMHLNLREATFFHGGGWKKIAETDQVTKEHFKEAINYRLGARKIHDYYGMAEQTGSILVECENGFMHTSMYSEVIIRDPQTHEVCDSNVIGLVETISLLPKSYPGHVLLTEDLGRRIGIDNCECGKLGSYFLIEGRIKRAEIRGCSDTYQVD